MAEVPFSTSNFPPLANKANPLYTSNGIEAIPARLRQYPQAMDKQKSLTDPTQQFRDCRTIEGWMDVLSRIMKAAWSNPDGSMDVQFTHDYALLPQDPQNLKGAIIVWDMVSMVPAHIGSHNEIKPRVRQAVPVQVSESKVSSNGERAILAPNNMAQWIWAQSFDVVMKFSVYGDTYSRKNTYVNKFMDLMLTYTKVFKETGLQQMFFRGILQEALYDPPRNEEFPNQSILYDARIERQTPASYATIQQVLVDAGVVNPVTGVTTDDVVGVSTGTPQSPILPNSV